MHLNAACSTSILAPLPLSLCGACAVVEIYAEWCGPSEALKNPLKNFHMNYVCEFKKLRLWKMCANLKGEEDYANDDEKKLFEKYKEEARPTILAFNGGELVAEPIVGVNVPGIEKARTLATEPTTALRMPMRLLASHALPAWSSWLRVHLLSAGDRHTLARRFARGGGGCRG